MVVDLVNELVTLVKELVNSVKELASLGKTKARNPSEDCELHKILFWL